MPDFGVAEFSALASMIAAGTGAAGAGLAIDKAVQTPDPSTVLNQQQQVVNSQQQAAKDAQKKAAVGAVSQGMPGLQSSTGGATTPDYNASVVGSSGGVSDPNVLQQAVTNWLGQNPNGAGGGQSPTTPGKTDFFPGAAVPAFAGLQPGQQPDAGLSGGSQ